MNSPIRTLYLCGAGNCEAVRLALDINRSQHRWDRIVLLDDDESKQGRTILGVDVIGPFATLADARPGRDQVVNLVSRYTLGRWKVRELLAGYGLPFASLIHPSVDTTGVEFGSDVIIYQNVVLGPETRIGEGSVIFMAAVLGNGSTIGRCCVLAPNSVVNARVEMGDGVYIGTNAAVLPDAKIGPWATVGACTSVLKNVAAGATVIGVPAKTVMTLDQKLRLSWGRTMPRVVREELEASAR